MLIIKSIILQKPVICIGTTSSLLKSYYRELLSAGQTKSKALHKAKLTYLETCPKAKAHPFYWAALNHIGNDKAIASISFFDNSNYTIIAILFASLLLFLLLKVITSNKKKSDS